MQSERPGFACHPRLRVKLIVGGRHPVKWFASFCNYRCRDFRVDQIPPPSLLIVACMVDMQTSHERMRIYALEWSPRLRTLHGSGPIICPHILVRFPAKGTAGPIRSLGDQPNLQSHNRLSCTRQRSTFQIVLFNSFRCDFGLVATVSDAPLHPIRKRPTTI
jgi:hypothetical protein